MKISKKENGFDGECLWKAHMLNKILQILNISNYKNIDNSVFISK